MFSLVLAPSPLSYIVEFCLNLPDEDISSRRPGAPYSCSCLRACSAAGTSRWLDAGAASRLSRRPCADRCGCHGSAARGDGARDRLSAASARRCYKFRRCLGYGAGKGDASSNKGHRGRTGAACSGWVVEAPSLPRRPCRDCGEGRQFRAFALFGADGASRTGGIGGDWKVTGFRCAFCVNIADEQGSVWR